MKCEIFFLKNYAEKEAERLVPDHKVEKKKKNKLKSAKRFRNNHRQCSTVRSLTIFMLHIYMLRCSCFTQVVYNWYCMGTIVLTVKNNNCKKLHCQKQPQDLFFQKIVHRMQLQIHRGNTQQVEFTPIKFAKQSY